MSDKKSVNHKKVVGGLLGGVVGMFAFGFALVPLYDVMCEALGINGVTSGEAYTIEEPDDLRVDDSRKVRVQFTTSHAGDMPWEFDSEDRYIKVHPGEVNRVNFVAHNPTDKKMTSQAIPSLSPSDGTPYFHKTECFCFQEQELEPGETVEMPLAFFVDDQAPQDLYRITLQYTIYDQTGDDVEDVEPVAETADADSPMDKG